MQHDTTIAFAPGALYTSMATTNLDPGFDMGPTTYAWTAFKGADFTNVSVFDRPRHVDGVTDWSKIGIVRISQFSSGLFQVTQIPTVHGLLVHQRRWG